MDRPDVMFYENMEKLNEELDRRLTIDRAMVWCEEYLREREVLYDHDDVWALKTCGSIRPIEQVVDDLDYDFDTCVRYLEKVEQQ